MPTTILTTLITTIPANAITTIPIIIISHDYLNKICQLKYKENNLALSYICLRNIEK